MEGIISILICMIILVALVIILLLLEAGISLKRHKSRKNQKKSSLSQPYHIRININADDQAMYTVRRSRIINRLDRLCRRMNIQARVSTSILRDASDDVNVYSSEDMCIDVYCSSEDKFNERKLRI